MCMISSMSTIETSLQHISQTVGIALVSSILGLGKLILTTLNSEIRFPHTNFLTLHTIYIYVIIIQKFITFELLIGIVATHQPPCVQMEVIVEIFVDFNGLYSSFW